MNTRCSEGDAASANPDTYTYTYLEEEDYLYGIRLAANQSLQGAVEHLCTRPVGRLSRLPKVFCTSLAYQAKS